VKKQQAIIFDLGGVLLQYAGALHGHLDDSALLDPQGLAFVQQCKKQGIRVLILSNCSAHSLIRLKNKFPELFSLFNEEDVFTSSSTGFRKPEIESYAHVVEATGLDAATTLFIDDSAINVKAAQDFGMQALLHTDWLATGYVLQKQE